MIDILQTAALVIFAVWAVVHYRNHRRAEQNQDRSRADG